MILFAFPVGKLEPAVPTVKVPGAYPYEETVRVPVPPPVWDSSPLPSPAPFPYRESSPLLSASQDRDSRTANARLQSSVRYRLRCHAKRMRSNFAGFFP